MYPEVISNHQQQQQQQQQQVKYCMSFISYAAYSCSKGKNAHAASNAEWEVSLAFNGLQTPTGRLQQAPSNIMVPGVLVPPLSESPQRPPPSTRFEKPSNTTSFDPYSRFGVNSLEASLSLTHTERRGTAANASWRIRDIDWKFCFRSQHYGTAFFALMIIIALGVIHWTAKPKSRPFCELPILHWIECNLESASCAAAQEPISQSKHKLCIAFDPS